MKKLLIVLIAVQLLLLAGGGALAETELTQWKYWKNVDITGDGQYKAVFLDEEVYRYASSDLSDIRIVDGNGNFSPYYLVRGYSVEK